MTAAPGAHHIDAAVQRAMALLLRALVYILMQDKAPSVPALFACFANSCVVMAQVALPVKTKPLRCELVPSRLVPLLAFVC